MSIWGMPVDLKEFDLSSGMITSDNKKIAHRILTF
jgi:hypothetical protein